MPGFKNETGAGDTGWMSLVASGGNPGSDGIMKVPAQYAMHPAHGDPCVEP
jgi:hypothetical protein